MIYLIIVAVIGAGLFVWTQQRKKKHNKVEKDALTLAWENKDYDAYLKLIDEKLAASKNIKEKNVIATLKMPVFVIRRDTVSMDALKKKVKPGELTKKIRVTFLFQYIIGLFVTGREQLAFRWLDAEKNIISEARANGTYSLYLETVDALDAFYRRKYDEAEELFNKLEARGMTDDMYAPIFAEYLEMIKDQKEA